MSKNIAVLVAVFAALVVVVWGVTSYRGGGQTGPTSTIDSPTTTTVPDATQPQPASGWQAYRGDGFTVQYPSSYRVDAEYSYSALGPGKEIPGVSFTVPASLTQGTNLSSDTHLSVERLNSAGGCNARLFLSDVAYQNDAVTENGATWSVAKGGGAGAGNFYDETVYATQRGSTCYGLRLFIHSTNIGNYDPGTVQEFDRSALDATFAQFRASFSAN